MTDNQDDRNSPPEPPAGGNRMFTREESIRIFGPHPHADWGDEIRARIATHRRRRRR